MSEWIKRSEQEPPTLAWVFKWDEHRSNTQPVWLSQSGPAGQFTHWQPANVPAPPPRTVTIELTESDAREWAQYPNDSMNLHEPSRRLYAACRKALEGQR